MSEMVQKVFHHRLHMTDKNVSWCFGRIVITKESMLSHMIAQLIRIDRNFKQVLEDWQSAQICLNTVPVITEPAVNRIQMT